MKYAKTAFAIITGLSLILSACSEKDVKDNNNKMESSIKKNKIEPTTEEPTTETNDESQNNISDSEDNVNIDTKNLKDQKGNLYKIPGNIKEISGTYSGKMIDVDTNKVFGIVEAKINEDGTYTVIKVAKINLAEFNIVADPQGYFNDKNEFKKIDSVYEVREVSSGVVYEAYGTNILAPLQYISPFDQYIDSKGEFDLIKSLDSNILEKDIIEPNKDLSKFENGKLIIDQSTLEKTDELIYKNELNKTAKKLSLEAESSRYTKENLNDFYQDAFIGATEEMTAMTPEELDEIYVDADKKANAKFGFKKTSENRFFATDGEKRYSGSYNGKPPFIVTD